MEQGKARADKIGATRGQAEERIHASEEKYRSLFENAREAFILTDRKGTVTAVNRLVEEYGFKREEFVGKSLFDFVVKDDRARALADFEILLGGQPVKGEMDVVTPKGVFSAEYRDNPIRQGDRVVGAQVILTDITKRKRMAQLLREERDKAQRYLDIAGVILVAIDFEQRVGLINKKGCEILGYTEQEVLAKNWFDSFLPPRVRNQARAVFEDLVAGQTRQYEYVENAVLTKTGEERVIGWHNTVLKDATGRIIGTLSSGQDITERKKAEQELRETMRLNQILLDAMPCVAFLLRAGTREVVASNEAARAVNAIPGTTCFGAWVHRSTPCPWCLAPEVWATGQARHLIVEYEGVVWDAHWLPIAGDLYMHYAFDITERKRAEEAYRSLVDHSLQGLAIFQDGRVVFANQAMAEIAGYTIDEMLAMPAEPLRNFVHPEDREIVWQRHRQRLAGESVPERYELRGIRKDGAVRWLEIHASRIDYRGRPAIQSAYMDVTDRKRADHLMRTLATTAMELVELPVWADLLRFVGEKVLALIGEGIVLVNSIEGDTLTVRQVVGATTVSLQLAQRLMGRTVIGMTLQEVHEEARSSLLTGKLTRVEGGLHELFFHAVPRPACWMLEKSLGIRECYSIGLRRPGRLLGNVTILTGSGTQLNAEVIEAFVNQASIAWERRKVQEAVLESEERFRTLYKSVQAGVILQRADGTIMHANQMACDILDMTTESIQGKTSADPVWQMILEDGTPVPGEDHPSMITLRTGEPIRGAVRGLFSKDPSHLRWLVINTDPLRSGDGGDVEQVLITFHDITKRKRAEEALRVSEERFRGVFQHAPVGIAIASLDGRAVAVNPAFAELVGYGADELIGRRFEEYAHPEDYPEEKRTVEEVLTGRRDGLEVEKRYVRKDGSIVWADVTLTTMRDTFGNVEFVVGIADDITARKLAEEKLRESEQKFRELFESAREAIILLDLEKRITDVNQFVEEYGFRREDLIGRNYLDFVVEPYREKAIKDFDLLRRGVPLGGEFEVNTPKGRIVAHYVDNPIVRDGNVVGVQSILTDVTERRKAEAALRASEERYRLLAHHASDVIWTMDLNSRFTYCSPSVAQTMGYTPQEILSKRPDEILTPASYESVMKILAEEMEMEREGRGNPFRSRTVEVEQIHKDGTRLWVESKASFLRDPDGKAIGIVGVTRDISQRKRIEQRLLDYQDRLRRLAAELTLAEERERRRIAVGVHDQIGQRLALTKLALQSLAAASPGGDVARVLNEACEEIETVIEDAHSLTFELSNPVLYEVGFEGAVESWLMRQVQGRHGIECTFTAGRRPLELDQETSVTLFHVVRELLTNVVKHAQAKHVDVRIRRIKETVQITVQDDGVGFQPVKNCQVVSKSGGFGLFNVQEKLDYLGGSVTIKSQLGKGSRVAVMAPLREVRSTREGDCRHEDRDRR